MSRHDSDGLVGNLAFALHLNEAGPWSRTKQNELLT